MQTITDALNQLKELEMLLAGISCTCSINTSITKTKVKEGIKKLKKFLEDTLLDVREQKDNNNVHDYECKFHVDNSHC